MAYIKDTVAHVARLAHLSFNENELDKFVNQFESILGYINTIEKLDLDNIEPMTQIVNSENVMREDIPLASISLQDALRNAPKKNDNFFKVPKVIE